MLGTASATKSPESESLTVQVCRSVVCVSFVNAASLNWNPEIEICVDMLHFFASLCCVCQSSCVCQSELNGFVTFLANYLQRKAVSIYVCQRFIEFFRVTEKLQNYNLA